MEESRKNVQKTAKVLYIISRIVQVALIVSCVTVLFLGIYALASDDNEVMEYFDSLMQDEGIKETINSIGIESINTTLAVIVSMVFHTITRLAIVIYLYIFGKFLHDIANGGQPFTKQNAKTLFYMSISFVVFIVLNPFVGVIMILSGLFLSHLIKYGAYLYEKAEETRHIQESMIVSFAEVVENKSEQTGLHVKRVAEYSKVLALELGYSEEGAEKIKLASMMHDIGKLLVPSEILEKPARLTPEEYDEIKKHPNYGVKLLKDVDGDVLVLARRIAHEHHERFDGRGYPDGLGATSISMEGRIVAVCDVYDALTSRRSYKDAWSPEKAYEEILKNKGTQFDETVVDAFVKAYDKIDEIRKKFID